MSVLRIYFFQSSHFFVALVGNVGNIDNWLFIPWNFLYKYYYEGQFRTGKFSNNKATIRPSSKSTTETPV